MRKLAITIIALHGLLAISYSQNVVKLNDELFISNLTDEIFVVTHSFPWESNSLIIKASESDVVIIDTPYDTASTSLVLNWIYLNLKPQKITAIATGFHVDNIGGNAILLKNGIDIYGSDLTVKLIEERGKQTQNQIISWLRPDQEKYRRAFETMMFSKPNKVYKIREGLQLNRGGLSFELYFPGESHSPDNIVVYVKELKLLFGGCMVKSLNSKNLGFTGDANLVEWPKSVESVLERFELAQLVIPHHGMWGNKDLLFHTLDLLKSFKRK